MIKATSPSPAEVRTARLARQLTAAQAASFIHSSERTWQAWESGFRKMHPGLWELFQRKTKPRRPAAAVT